MPIDKATHPEYDDRIDDWRRCRVVLAGRESKVKAPDFREMAIPKLDGHLIHPKGGKLYESYVRRAQWFPAAARTFRAAHGALTHKPDSLVPSREGLLEQEPLRSFLADVTGTGVSWDTFLDSAKAELIRVNRGGVLVDFSAGPAPSAPRSRQPDNRRPTLTWYRAEAIEDWQYGDVGGREILVYVKLRETASALGTAADPFERHEETVYRELRLRATEGAGPIYSQTVWRQRKGEAGKAGDWYAEEPRVPLVDGQPLREIPFILAPKRTAEEDVRDPPFLPLVTANLYHLRTSADYMNALRQAGSPQHILSGPGIEKKGGRDSDGNPVPVKDETLVLGAERIWTYPDSVAGQTLTISAEAVAALELAMQRIERQLPVLGARLLEAERPAESGVAKEVDTRRDSSMLTRTAIEAAEAVEAAIALALPWLSLPGVRLGISPSLDFFTAPITPAEVAMWQGLRQDGTVAVNDVRRALREGERLPSDRTDDQIEAELEVEAPPGLGVPASEAGPGGRR